MRMVVAALACLATSGLAGTLQERIDSARPGETIRVAPGVHAGALVINKAAHAHR